MKVIKKSRRYTYLDQFRSGIHVPKDNYRPPCRAAYRGRAPPCIRSTLNQWLYHRLEVLCSPLPSQRTDLGADPAQLQARF